DFIDVLGETRENMKLIEISTNKTLEINELGPKVSETDLNQLINNLKKRIKKEDIIILSGSLPKDLSQNTYYKLIKTFKTLGVITVLDASGEAFNVALKALPTIIKPNIFELRSALNESLTDESSIVNALKKLVDNGIELALCTLGKDGALAVSKSDVYKIHPLNLKANSTVGAGDAFISGLCYKLETNASLLEALKYASAVASSAVLTENTSIGSKTIIDKLYQQIKITNLREEENLC
ncbi:MAG: 1-phosphofructokinase family hexose kinase, partial [Candidatus Izemoplasmataceae bacterium]